MTEAIRTLASFQPDMDAQLVQLATALTAPRRRVATGAAEGVVTPGAAAGSGTGAGAGAGAGGGAGAEAPTAASIAQLASIFSATSPEFVPFSGRMPEGLVPPAGPDSGERALRIHLEEARARMQALASSAPVLAPSDDLVGLFEDSDDGGSGLYSGPSSGRISPALPRRSLVRAGSTGGGAGTGAGVGAAPSWADVAEPGRTVRLAASPLDLQPRDLVLGEDDAVAFQRLGGVRVEDLRLRFAVIALFNLKLARVVRTPAYPVPSMWRSSKVPPPPTTINSLNHV